MTRIERAGARAIVTAAAACGIDVSVGLIASRVWSSALFAGFRLTFAITADADEPLDQWLAALPDADLPVAGHFVGSTEVVARCDRAASIELLVVAEG